MQHLRTWLLRRPGAGQTPHWAALVLLGLLALRALVPAGFMLGTVDGHLGFVVCEAGLATDHPMHHAGMHHAGMHHEGMPGHSGAHDSDCPYAQSAGAAPLPTLPWLAGALVPGALVALSESQQAPALSGPTREPASRGPPLLVLT